jgi:hypothetical protein
MSAVLMAGAMVVATLSSTRKSALNIAFLEASINGEHTKQHTPIELLAVISGTMQGEAMFHWAYELERR